MIHRSSRKSHKIMYAGITPIVIVLVTLTVLSFRVECTPSLYYHLISSFFYFIFRRSRFSYHRFRSIKKHGEQEFIEISSNYAN